MGINLLREGLDLPEVSLVPYLMRTRRFSPLGTFPDSDIGRAAHAEGRVIMADQIATLWRKPLVKQIEGECSNQL